MRTILVCLPAHIPTRRLAEAAETRLTLEDLHPHGTMPHFLPGTRRSGKLLHRWRDTTAGGPLGLLDLDGMRAAARAAASAQWCIWRDIVAGTRPARPYWQFHDRHRDDPQRYPLRRAQQDYLGQHRIQAMRAYSMRPDRACDLGGTHLEALQAGHATFTWLATQAAVSADGITTADGEHDGWLAPASGRLDDLLTYLRAANAYLARLHPRVNVVAMAVPL